MDITRHDLKSIDHAENKLLVFHCIDVVRRYDCVNPPNSGKITQKDIELANVMGARFGELYSRNIVDRDISFVPDNLDLITMPTPNWNLCKQAIKEPLQDLLNLPLIAAQLLHLALSRLTVNLDP